ncbi:uncharacterized protein LOC142980276 [Anticarsia gemmatalis]|uniref:uncharacterized protein LOC142980276 n=1 Tax=Anticarsia gemmatalis TaxID=129554 RepID=UPI003F75F465
MNTCRRFTANSLIISRKVTLTMKKLPERPISSINSTSSNFDMAKEKTGLLHALPAVIDEFANNPKFVDIPVAKDWVKKVLKGTLLGGKFSRGLTTVMAYKMVEKPENMTDETVRLARTLGWCTEIFQAYCTVLDDIMDGSQTRRGRPCWYLRDGVGVPHALNDSILIYSALHQILRDNFENSPFYVQLYQTFNEILIHTSIGQFLDITGSERPLNYDFFTRKNYEDIIINKSAYYTYQLPVSIGLMLADHLTEESLQNCKDMSIMIGMLFQIQDDYIDCFGDEKVTGKIGSDIQEGKCTWLAVNALPRCSAKERIIFTACYGSEEPAHVERIQQLYIRLQIPELYKKEQQKLYSQIVQKIENIPSDVERELYKKLLDMTYQLYM